MNLDVKAFEKRLLERKTELQGRLQKIEGDLEKPRDSDFAEMASERENDEVLEGIGSVGLDEIKQIDAALHRIKTGTYGYCVDCGEEIPEKRLEIIPYAVKCTDCSE